MLLLALCWSQRFINVLSMCLESTLAEEPCEWRCIHFCVLSINTVPGTKLMAGKFCSVSRCMGGWVDGWMGTAASAAGRSRGKRDWKEKRQDALGQWLMKFYSCREGLGLEASLKSSHLQSRNLTLWFHKKGPSLSHKWLDLTMRPSTWQFALSESFSSSSW